MGTWNYVINDSFTEQYGPDASARFAQMLGTVAGRVRPGDREGAAAMLSEGFADLGFDMPAKESDQLAENLTLDEHDRVVISDGSGAIVGDYPIASNTRVTAEEEREHVAPDDVDRPAYS